MANFNPETLKAKLAEAAVNVLQAQTQAVNEGMLQLTADFKDRIFQDGQDNDGNQIGSYSTKPMYVSISSQTSQVKKSGLKAKGKYSNKDFANGKKRRSQYFPDGYKGYRDAVGRQSGKVDLFLTGDMFRDIRLGISEGSVQLAFASDFQVQKANGNEERFNKVIFAPSEEELKNLTDAWEEQTTKAFFDSFE